MVNESDEKYEGHEEGEYHFSDDQLNYEVDTETQKVSEAAAAVTVKQSPMEMVSKYRRILIAGAVFFILMFIVYKMLSPVTTAPTTEFSQQTTTTTKTTTKPTVQVAKAQQVTTAPVAATTQAMTQNQLPPQQQAAPSQAMMPNNQMAPPANMQNPPLGQMNPQPTTMAMQQASQAGGNMQMQQQQPQSSPDASQNINDRVAQLEQANAKLTNVLQIEYSQKMTDYQNQTAATQARLQELSKRVANMEAALTQITQLLQDSGKQVSAQNTGMPSAKAASPKQLYTVQAIIPGRAWLKSDAGDTVTVAEGDVLRDYGRVTKIDPYDGVVEIDTGNKMVSLSYGAGTD